MTEKKVFYIHYKEKKEKKQCWSVKKGNTETLQN